ncbi:VanZ family protein [Microbacterium sp. G2-8]|uniref:VanZ family protein n=1 Tax=Microbacterium sp. G2-8 TaxID=2842454 RepID=UPI001C89DF11|nr:VanZ family protein [Microbacterium sp. G2-8]
MTYADDDRKPPRSRLRVGLATLLFFIYLAFVIWVTMTPSLDGVGVDSVADRVLRVLHRVGVPDAFGYMELEFVANIGMFVPLGFLLGLALPGWGWWLALLLLPAYSGAIEWVQGEYLGGRVSDMRDIVANSIGAWIGTFVAATLRGMVHARDRKVLDRAMWQRERERRAARPPQERVAAPPRAPYVAPARDPYASAPRDAQATAVLDPYEPAPRGANDTAVLDPQGWSDRTPTAETPTQRLPY